jgi:hypothetical protein
MDPKDKDKKKSFLLRLSPEMLSKLEQWAQDEFRSVNGQIEYLLRQALHQAGRLRRELPPPDDSPLPPEN